MMKLPMPRPDPLARWYRWSTAAFLLLFVSLPLLSDELQTAPMNPPDIGLAADFAPGEVTGGLREGSHVKLFLSNLVWCKYSNEPYDIVIEPYYG